jgi:hypothetical protein
VDSQKTQTAEKSRWGGFTVSELSPPESRDVNPSARAPDPSVSVAAFLAARAIGRGRCTQPTCVPEGF